MSPNDKAGLHAAIWRNTAREPRWLGYWLARHLQTEDFDESQLADKLGVSMDKLALVCLCHTPRDGQLFKDDLRQICASTGAAEAVLAQILRQEQNRLQWSQAGPGNGGWLAAACDAPPEPDNDR